MYHLFLSSSSLLLLLNKFLQYNALLKLTSSFKRTDGRSGDTGTSNTPANISCFPRRLQRNTFHLPRRVQDVFAIRLPKMSSRRLQDVFARPIAIMSSRRLQDVLEDKKMLY